jgi:ubiquinone/menaquinone biosynthesis C-methylase UbiE
MKTVWDYTQLAEGYRKRADYSKIALEKMYKKMGLSIGACICDVGAGIGHLTLPLLTAGFSVTAIEPNDAMRAIGEKRTKGFSNLKWIEATAEDTKQKESFFDAVTYGSSFNVCDKDKALIEAKKIAKQKGWFACMWNHRDLKDPIQKAIEKIIAEYNPEYSYGDRRQDQTPFLSKSPHVQNINYIEDRFIIQQTIEEAIVAWSSHGTVQRQVGECFDEVLEKIADYLHSLGQPIIEVPYETKIWVAQFTAK